MLYLFGAKKMQMSAKKASYSLLYKCLGGYYSSLFFSKSIIFFISGKALRNLSGMSSNVL